MVRTLAVLALAAALAGCTTAVKLRNPATGATASCGPYYVDSGFSNAQAERESRCISDFQRQGFERVPE